MYSTRVYANRWADGVDAREWAGTRAYANRWADGVDAREWAGTRAYANRWADGVDALEWAGTCVSVPFSVLSDWSLGWLITSGFFSVLKQ